jgi:hypothetical protein
MRKLREQGFSYWKIADVFNSMKVPTKTGRGRWHARAIQNVLENAALASVPKVPVSCSQFLI